MHEILTIFFIIIPFFAIGDEATDIYYIVDNWKTFGN